MPTLQPQQAQSCPSILERRCAKRRHIKALHTDPDRRCTLPDRWDRWQDGTWPRLGPGRVSSGSTHSHSAPSDTVTPPLPTRPQMHARKHHDAYNGARHLPVATFVRSPAVRATADGEHDLLYEIVLYYAHNRACVIYRSWDDFVTLRKSVVGNRADALVVQCPSHVDVLHVDVLHAFLKDVLRKKAGDPGLEYFLRRRMEDCGGA